MERMTAADYREMIKKPSKYRAKKTVIDGITFDSKAEAEYYIGLKLLQRAGEVVEFKRQVKFPLLDPYEKEGKKVRGINYIADFVVTYKDGRQEIIDVKGFRTRAYRDKKKMFEARYPHLTIKEVEG